MSEHINIGIIGGPPTKEERDAYEEAKFQRWLASLDDPEKQTRKKVLAITAFKGIRVGLCPVCNHCLMWGDLTCNECFQKVTWYD